MERGIARRLSHLCHHPRSTHTHARESKPRHDNLELHCMSAIFPTETFPRWKVSTVVVPRKMKTLMRKPDRKHNDG